MQVNSVFLGPETVYLYFHLQITLVNCSFTKYELENNLHSPLKHHVYRVTLPFTVSGTYLHIFTLWSLSWIVCLWLRERLSFIGLIPSHYIIFLLLLKLKQLMFVRRCIPTITVIVNPLSHSISKCQTLISFSLSNVNICRSAFVIVNLVSDWNRKLENGGSLYFVMGIFHYFLTFHTN